MPKKQKRSRGSYTVKHYEHGSLSGGRVFDHGYVVRSIPGLTEQQQKELYRMKKAIMAAYGTTLDNPTNGAALQWNRYLQGVVDRHESVGNGATAFAIRKLINKK